MNKTSRIVFSIVIFLCSKSLLAKNQITINIISENNGYGLERDKNILANELEKLGCLVYKRNWNDNPNEDCIADVNIFFEKIDPSWKSLAKFNWFIPNPEIFHLTNSFEKIDLILCRTKEVERIFQKLDFNTFYLGFTSMDQYIPEIEKNFSEFLHVAGMSPFKGTPVILDVWKRNPDLSKVTIIKQTSDLRPLLKLLKLERTKFLDLNNVNWQQKRLNDQDLKVIQNHVGIHLCLSETEGFGHYLMEALSCGAVVIATDAPPMNEFVTDKRFLVKFEKKRPFFLADRYFADPNDLERVIKYVLTLTTDELKEIGINNRKSYQTKTNHFRKNLEELILNVKEN